MRKLNKSTPADRRIDELWKTFLKAQRELHWRLKRRHVRFTVDIKVIQERRKRRAVSIDAGQS